MTNKLNGAAGTNETISSSEVKETASCRLPDTEENPLRELKVFFLPSHLASKQAERTVP